MSNRLPSAVKKYLEKNAAQNKTQLDFLSFSDWLNGKENESSDWIVVARMLETEFASQFTFSALAANEEKTISRVLKTFEWDVDMHFGIPNKYIKPGDDEVYNDGTRIKKRGLVFTPFSFLRDFGGHVPACFEMIQHFLLYYNAFWSATVNEWKSVSEDGKLATIARHRKQQGGKNEIIEIDAHYLKDYLAVRQCMLVRYHDHKRRSEEDIKPFLKDRYKEIKIKNELSHFQLFLRTDIQYDAIKSTSSILGKDIVTPYEHPVSHDWRQQLKEKQFADFIIGRDTVNGKEISHSANHHLLSSYFKDKNTPHYLTPVFFKKDVLQKYYAQPALYEVTDFTIGYMNQWKIDYDINGERLVHVYLGDLGRNLPYEEQVHWKHFNVTPKGEMSDYRFDADMLNQWPEPKMEQLPIHFFRTSLEKIKSITTAKYGSPIFLELEPKDAHLYKTVRVPLNEEWQELDEQILALSKITNDSLNSALMSKVTGKKINDTDSKGMVIKGSLHLFHEFLSRFFSDEEMKMIIGPFNIIQALRSSGSAHRKGSAYDKNLVKYGFDNMLNEEKIRSILLKLIYSLDGIAGKIELEK